MRQILLVVISFIGTTASFAQTSKEKDFLATLSKVVVALSSRDSVTLSRDIDTKTGVYIINRIGVVDTYKRFPSLGFSDTTYPNVPFYDGVKLTPVNYSGLPTYDCIKWSKNGTFVDTTRVDQLLSKTAIYLKKEFKDEVPAKTIADFQNLESKSRRIIIAEDNGNELVIYLSFINGQWVLTIIDKVTCDCSS